MRPPERTRVRVSPGAPALLAVFVWLSSPEVLGAVLLAALCHELGHYAVLRSRGGWVRHMEISALGANMQVAGRLSYGSELLTAAGGPAVNLLLAAALAALGRWWEPLYLLAGAQGVLGCFNLLPILPLDGGRMLWLALCWRTDPFLADRMAGGVSLAAAGLLTAAGAALAGRSPFLLMTAVNLLLAAALAALGRWWEPLYLLAGAQGVLGCFNLLPILPLDGGRMLWLALCWRTDPFLADRMAGGVSLAAAGLLTAAGAALAGRSPFLLMTAVCLLCCTAGPCIKRRKSVYASGKREASA